MGRISHVLRFFGFFRAREIKIPSLTSFDNSRHLSGGDVSIDNHLQPRMLKVHLKYSKTDQWEKVWTYILELQDVPYAQSQEW